MDDYNIFELEEYVNVQLVGTHNMVLVVNPIFKLSRYAIAEGIFESKLASEAGCSMSDGNVYKLYFSDDNIIYVHCNGVYAYFGTQIAHNQENDIRDGGTYYGI